MNEKKITQEQARKILCEYLAFDKDEHSEFLDAIRTLITQADEVCDKDCEHCAWTECPKDDAQADGDLISREAVIDIIEDVCPIYGNDYRYILREKVNELPSVAIPNNVGHWIGIDEEPHEDYECDRCGCLVGMQTANVSPYEEYKYCPKCGCLMVEPQERSDKE